MYRLVINLQHIPADMRLLGATNPCDCAVMAFHTTSRPPPSHPSELLILSFTPHPSTPTPNPPFKHPSSTPVPSKGVPACIARKFDRKRLLPALSCTLYVYVRVYVCKKCVCVCVCVCVIVCLCVYT